MNHRKNMLKSTGRTAYLTCLIYIIPALYLLMGFYFRQIFGDLSLRNIDPEYIHFVSGLSVSLGKFTGANIDQPASVLHLLMALIFRIVYFFRPHNLPYFEDVIYHSDLYLAVVNLVITIIIATVLLKVGKASFQITGNIVFALALQTAPFLLNIWYDLTGRIYVEMLFVIPVMMLQVLLLRELYGPAMAEKTKTLYLALAMAMGLSLKMTFLPWIVLPLFLLKGIKPKLNYLFFTILFFLVLSPPVLFQFNRFWHWMLSLFMHNGTYESGSQTIINFPLFLKNMETLFAQNAIFFYTIFLFVVVIIAGYWRQSNKTIRRIGWGIILSIAGVIFITAKHFEMRYFISALLFFPFLLVLIAKYLSDFFKMKIVYYASSLLVILVIGYQIKQEIPYMRIVSQSVDQQVTARKKTRDYIKTLPHDSYKIIVSQDYGCPFQEYAIMYCFSMGGKNLPHRRAKLNKLYPNTFQYFTWDNSIRDWGKGFHPDSIVASNKPVYLYLEKNNKARYKRTIHKFFGDTSRYSVDKKYIFVNPQNHEALLQLFVSKKQDLDSKPLENQNSP